jgi:hypothetical protein
VPDSAKQPTEATASGAGEQLESLQLRLDRLESMVADLPQPAPTPSQTDVSREDLQRLQRNIDQQGQRIASLTEEIKEGLDQSKSSAMEIEEKVASQSEALRTELASRMLESQKQIDRLRELQLVWRVDELVQRSRYLRSGDAWRQNVNKIRTLLSELDEMKLSSRNADYVAETKEWINRQSSGR